MTLESAIGEQVVVFLKRQGFTVYQEVRHGERIADIVAVQGDRSLVVEVKASARNDVIVQAMKWIGVASSVLVAVPLPSNRELADFFCEICADRGIGVISVGAKTYQIERPRFYSGVTHPFNLKPENLNAKAGTANHSERVTKKGTTAEMVRELVAEHPEGISLADIVAMDGVGFRAGDSGVVALRKAIRKGEIEGVELKSRGSVWTAFPAGTFFGRVGA